MNNFSAALEWRSGKIYLFSGDQYVGVDPTTNQAVAGYPRPIVEDWPGLFEQDIDAAVLWNNGKAYFFKGDQYVRYDVETDRADEGYPRPIAGSWPGVFERDIDAAVMWNNGKAYFFKGDQYIRYDVVTDRADAGYPRPIAGNWPGLFTTRIDDAFNWTLGKVLFLRNEEYINYDIAADQVDPGYPRPIPAAWFGGQQADHQINGDPALPESSWLELPARERVVRCCDDIFAAGPMGYRLREDFYRSFINCGMQPIQVEGRKVDDLSPVHTSCAIFVRAVHHWCGRSAQEVISKAGIYNYLQVSEAHPAWVPYKGTNRPNPGDVFFIASKQNGTDGHVGIFLREVEPDVWETAEGGGSDGPGGADDGTFCRLSSQNNPPFVRSFQPGVQFDSRGRSLRGWFDCDSLEFPPPG